MRETAIRQCKLQPIRLQLAARGTHATRGHIFNLCSTNYTIIGVPLIIFPRAARGPDHNNLCGHKTGWTPIFVAILWITKNLIKVATCMFQRPY
jgi:hypothetical protein